MGISLADCHPGLCRRKLAPSARKPVSGNRQGAGKSADKVL